MRIFLLLILSVSFSVIACPDLKGKFKDCYDKDRSTFYYDLNINQVRYQGSHVLSLTLDDDWPSQVYITNGQPITTYDLQSDGKVIETKTKAQCAGGKLIINETTFINRKHYWSSSRTFERENSYLKIRITTKPDYGPPTEEKYTCELKDS